jgi:3-oxoacyl-(acyl-carrier-protein) synthase
MGAVTPLGLSVEESWAGLVAGRSGITDITLFDASDLPIRIAGEVKGFDVTDYVDIKEARRMARARTWPLPPACRPWPTPGSIARCPTRSAPAWSWARA